MKEFVEKLIGRLEEEHEKCINRYGVVGGNAPAIEVKQCIEIVNQFAEEYKEKDCSKCSRRSWYQIGYADAEKNNGWIPCSERLPDDFMSMEYLTTVKGHFYSEVNYYCVANHKWYSNERTTKEVKVIAWMPLPASFKKGE